jgi:hypothetical protein
MRLQLLGRDNGLGISRPVNRMGGMHRFGTEGCGSALDQGDVIPELHAEAAGRLYTGIGNHANQDDLPNAVLARSPIAERFIECKKALSMSTLWPRWAGRLAVA